MAEAVEFKEFKEEEIHQRVYHPRPVTEAPKELVSDGVYNMGCFNTPVKRANLLEIPNQWGIPLQFDFIKTVQLREWQAFQAYGSGFFVMMAIYNAKKIALVQFIVYDIVNKKKTKYEKQVMPWELAIPDSLYETTAWYKSDNFSIEAHHNLSKNLLEISVSIKGFPDLPNIEAKFNGIHDTKKYTPMVVCNPFSYDRVMYSHKCLMPVDGEVKMGDDVIVFEQSTALMIIDDHKGYYPYITEYDWVTGLGYDKHGRMVGFNLTNNQVVNQDLFNENCLWLDGELHPLPPVTVTRRILEKVWVITDRYDRVSLEFTVATDTFVNVNYVVIASNYNGPYGFYNGYIRKSNGEKVMIENLFGMGEDFYLRA